MVNLNVWKHTHTVNASRVHLARGVKPGRVAVCYGVSPATAREILDADRGRADGAGG